MSRLPHAQGPGQDRWSLHIAGLNNTGYAIRLHRMGQAGRSGLEQVEGRDYRGAGAGRAYVGLDQDVLLWDCAVSDGHVP
jgi:hypothetical protein